MPSDASLSRFGVFPDMMPRWYAPMLNQPTSSPMMTIMFGGRCCCCAVAGKVDSVKVVDSATALVQTRLRILMVCFLRLISDRSCSERVQRFSLVRIACPAWKGLHEALFVSWQFTTA